ncbi:hypothetical protein ES703_85848 [subsurface metagenome]
MEHRRHSVIMVFEGGGGRDAGFAGTLAPNIKPFSGTDRPAWLPPGVAPGIAWFFLLIVLKDSKAKANIFGESNTPA